MTMPTSRREPGGADEPARPALDQQPAGGDDGQAADGQAGGAPPGLLPAARLFGDRHQLAVFRRRYQVDRG
jgi:hypothetical protein